MLRVRGREHRPEISNNTLMNNNKSELLLYKGAKCPVQVPTDSKPLVVERPALPRLLYTPPGAGSDCLSQLNCCYRVLEDLVGRLIAFVLISTKTAIFIRQARGTNYV